MHRYVYLLIKPEERPRDAHDQPRPVVHASSLSPEERAYVDSMPTKGPMHELFKKLCIYFRGSHHLEEIMYQENITRSELRAVLTTYSDVAVTCLHE